MCKESKEKVSFLFNRVLLTLANQVQAENQMSQSHTEAMYVAGICDGCQARENAWASFDWLRKYSRNLSTNREA